MKALTFLLLGLVPLGAIAADATLKPLLAVPDQAVLKSDFSEPGPLPKPAWGARQGTQWVIEDGVLRGRPSTAEYRAKRKDHFGYEPRVSAPATPAEFVAEFSIRFLGGTESNVSPFIEFGHHVCRIRLNSEGTAVIIDHESIRAGEAKDFKFQPDHWYHVMAELKGDEFVIQFEDGPTFYVRHESLASPASSGSNGLGVAGTKEGTVEIDNVTLWSVKPEAQPTWAATRAKLPKFEQTPVVKGPVRKPAKK